MGRTDDRPDGETHRGGGAEWERLTASAGETWDRLADWYATVERRARRRPGQALATAVGAGFVLGGGLLTGLSLRLLRAAARLTLRGASAVAVMRVLGRLLEDRRGGRRIFDVPSSA